MRNPTAGRCASNYPEFQYIIRERERLISAIERAAEEGGSP